MEEYVNRLHTAVRKSDYAELRRLIQQLVMIGSCDQTKAQEILSATVK